MFFTIENNYYGKIIDITLRAFLDYVKVINVNHLRKLLKEYFHYYDNHRTHLGFNKDSTESGEVQATREIEIIPVASGLHNFYFRKAA